MKIDLVVEPRDEHSHLVHMKPGWKLWHSITDPNRVGCLKELHADKHTSVTMSIDFFRDVERHATEAALTIMHRDEVLGVSEELFSYPLPVDVAANFCFTKV